MRCIIDEPKSCEIHFESGDLPFEYRKYCIISGIDSNDIEFSFKICCEKPWNFTLTFAQNFQVETKRIEKVKWVDVYNTRATFRVITTTGEEIEFYLETSKGNVNESNAYKIHN